jgi:outer membrane receptor for Fe3+-dicitrate
LINVPKSLVDGVELSGRWVTPIEGLSLKADVTYLDTRVSQDYSNFNQLNQTVNIKGEAFPFSPKWSAHAGAHYAVSLSNSLQIYYGANYSYRTSTTAEFGHVPEAKIDSYGVLDLTVGVRSPDRRWYGELFGLNVTDRYYWVDGNLDNNTAYRRTGIPRTYGLRLGYEF